VTNISLKTVDLPKPSPDQKLYKSVISAGFDAYPQRRENYNIFVNSSRNSSYLNYLPIKLDIENVSRCNFHCTMCSVSKWHKLTRARDMTMDEFKNLIDEQYGLVEIKLQGLGEPFLSKDFIPMVKFARERDIWVRSTTNASLLDRNDNYKEIIHADICELQVSIDGASKGTFEKIRAGSRFEKVIANSTLLNEYASKENRHRTRAWTLVQRDNFHELEDIVLLCAEMGFKRLTFSLDVEDTAWIKTSKSHISNIDRKDKFNLDNAWDLVDIGKNKDIEVTFWITFDKFETNMPENLCPWPFERAVISSDMRVVPCCMIANPDIYELGDGSDFSNTWNSDTYQKFRQAHLSSDIPGICKKCYL
jgi:pyrroloquinoline quinone biosynthesis protein E|tara:strand:- start:16 stop:1104 length:1089 start_codon:yes stop_codon:yes gene_type:complete